MLIFCELTKEVSIKIFNSDLFVTLIQSFLISLYSFYLINHSLVIWHSRLFEGDLIVFFSCMYGFPCHENLRRSVVLKFSILCLPSIK